ncbi:hypothetical protein PG996_003654 [Apiospora saccharicola]|uniref:RRM domain-containing protein n=1 Tax=Apiospora saccharicola TaxID=335842 RepID=A0ABR1W1X0_9PEZI
MSSPVAELEAGLNAMLGLKPPGVSGSQIKNLTALCVDNVQSESVLIQKIFTHFKKTPGTHKLGVLYVVDSVTRRWVEHAKQQGQPINSSATDGTYAAGVHRVTELIPVLMNDILQSAPAAQKESTTPVGTPPPGPGLPGLPGFNGANNPKPATTEAPNAIMEALANIARQNTSVPPSNNGFLMPDHSYSAPASQSAPALQMPLPLTQGQPPDFPYSAAPPPVNPSMMPFAYPPQATLPGQVPNVPVTASSQPNGFPGAPANPMAPPMSGLDPAVAQQVQLIKLLIDQGISHDKIPALLATMQGGLQSMSPVGGMAVAPPAQAPYGGVGAWPQAGPRPDESRDRFDYGARSPNRYRNRSRSRSPRRGWNARDSPRGRNDRTFGSYGHDSPARGHMEDDRRGRAPDYRQRSPPRRGHSPQPPFDRDPQVKWVDFDQSIPAGHIKVLSRTLFVGGVTCSEAELRSLFSQQGQVQTCIVNKDKRHAFVKMVTRRDAVAAKEAMESSQYRTRWGVGFGPRDCSDYSTGVSVIPINKLTEADRKWMLSAEYGGSGGRTIESGMVVEEPDIEIGAGVSSKAISRRMQTDKGGRHGPKSSRGGDEEDANLARWRRNKDRRDDRPEEKPVGVKQDPDVPQFPYGLATGPNGMPVFPPGFTFPAPQ